MKVLHCGSCEEMKLGVHATSLGLALLCGAYNAAAWLARREHHLAVNTVLYSALIVWEQRHVAHHLKEMRRVRPEAVPVIPSVETAELPVDVAA